MAKTHPNLPTVARIAKNLRRHRAAATAEQVREGLAWYPGMSRFIATVAAEAADDTGDYGVSHSLAVGVFCAFSQNATWRANVTMAGNYLAGRGRGMTNVLAECEAMEDGRDPFEVLHGKNGVGFKRPAFYKNFTGDLSYVTCDRWHLRAALGKECPLTRDVYDAVSEATRIVAAEYGEAPAETQAIIWCHIRPSGDGK